MGEKESTEFLTYLALEENVAASTQNQALSALLFLYREVVLAENAHPFEKPSLRMDSPSGLFGLTGRLLSG